MFLQEQAAASNMDPFSSAQLGTIEDADSFYEEFQTFLQEAPRISPPGRLYAVVTIDYETYVRGEILQESTTFTTRASAPEGSLEVWWRNHVLYPAKRLLDRFTVGDVVNITYSWE